MELDIRFNLIQYIRQNFLFARWCSILMYVNSKTVPLGNRICPNCQHNTIEDEIHFILRL